MSPEQIPEGRQEHLAEERAERSLRFGRISYVNMAPVFYRLDHEVEEVGGVPTELNAA